MMQKNQTLYHIFYMTEGLFNLGKGDGFYNLIEGAA